MQIKHTKRICKDFWTTNLSKYHDLYFQINTIFLTTVFNNFQNILKYKKKKNYKKIKKWFWKGLFLTMKIFQNYQENVRKHRHINKLVTNWERRNFLVPELNYHTSKMFTRKLLAIAMKKHKYSWTNLSIEVYQY